MFSQTHADHLTPVARLHVTHDLAAGATILFDDGQAHYLRHVLRAAEGASLRLFNGRDGEWAATLVLKGKRDASARLTHQTRPQSFSPDVWLAFAPVKRTPGDYIAQKATELGARALIPVITRRTIVTRVNEERLRANVIEAAEQTGRLDVPECRPPVTLPALLSSWPELRTLIFCDEAGASERSAKTMVEALRDLPPNSPMAILTGPEGGFDPAERASILKLRSALPVSLGPRILRADTAALAALAILQAIKGDWR